MTASKDYAKGLIDGDDLSTWASAFQRRYQADEEIEQVIEKIRAQPGFGDFLLPPELEGLKVAAREGPIIVINVSVYRCDAFLVEKSGVRVLELPSLKSVDVDNWAMRLKSGCDFFSLLKWLWDTACGPCLDALNFRAPQEGESWDRVWWVPTGRLCELPLHAAGNLVPGSRDSVMDRMISSYASSIKNLLHSRREQSGDGRPKRTVPATALLVAMKETPPERGKEQNKYGELREAEREIEEVKKYCRSLHLTPVVPGKPVKAEVMSHLADCSIFHFAGHGESAPDPNESRIILIDWGDNPLTFGDLREHWVEQDAPFLAFLSACSTASNTEKALVDEAVHLVSAFQLSGFQNVTKTLWEVYDEHCLTVAEILYETMKERGMTSESVSLGLHRAMLCLREKALQRNNPIPRTETTIGAQKKRMGEEGSDIEDEGECPVSKRRITLVDSYWTPYVHFGA